MATRAKVEVFEQIRKAREHEGLSVRGLARRFNVHRRTVRQALESPVPPPRKTAPARVSPVLDPWKATIDGWLEADRHAPKKQRHTARRCGSASSRSRAPTSPSRPSAATSASS